MTFIKVNKEKLNEVGDRMVGSLVERRSKLFLNRI